MNIDKYNIEYYGIIPHKIPDYQYHYGKYIEKNENEDGYGKYFKKELMNDLNHEYSDDTD